VFTEQIAAMGAKLREGGWDDGLAAAFEQLMGSCAATYSHRGTLNFPGLTLTQVPPVGQTADYVLPPQFTVPPVGHVQLGQVTGDPVLFDDPRLGVPVWHVPVDPVGDIFGNPIPDPVNGAPTGPITVTIIPTGGGTPVVEPGDIIQWSYVNGDAYGGGATPKMYDHLCENRWLTAMRAAGVTIEVSDGPPTDGTEGTGAGYADTGSLCIDYGTPDLWQNIGDADSPVWVDIGFISTT